MFDVLALAGDGDRKTLMIFMLWNTEREKRCLATHTHARTHTHTHTRTHTHTHTHTHTPYTHTRTHTHTHTHTRATHTHAHTHTHKNPTTITTAITWHMLAFPPRTGIKALEHPILTATHTHTHTTQRLHGNRQNTPMTIATTPQAHHDTRTADSKWHAGVCCSHTPKSHSSPLRVYG